MGLAEQGKGGPPKLQNRRERVSPRGKDTEWEP